MCFWSDSQIPFDKIFKRILLVCDDKQGMDIYDIHATNELHVLKLIEFTKQLVSILGQGFVSYYTDRYAYAELFNSCTPVVHLVKWKCERSFCCVLLSSGIAS